MRSPASIRSHPIHPMLIAFPIGLWVFSRLFLFNLGSRYNAPPGNEFFGVVLSIIAIAFLAVSGWLGGSLVYVHGMAVEGQSSKEEERRVA
jgi:uncharacterized membrane protein